MATQEAPVSEYADDAILVFADSDDPRRRHQRWFVDFETTIEFRAETLRCSVYDLSPGGVCVEVLDQHTILVGDNTEFALPGYGRIPAEIRYSDGGYLGLKFLHDTENETELARYLVEIERTKRPAHTAGRPESWLRASGVELACLPIEITLQGARVRLEETRHISPDQEVTVDFPDSNLVAALVTSVDDHEVSLAFLQKLN